MGGTAFTQAAATGQPTLRTPRMSPEDYARLKTKYAEELRQYFPHSTVEALKEAPGKTDFGDIDFVITAPVDQKLDSLDLARKLGAKGVIYSSGGGYRRCHLAVPLDGSKATEVIPYKHIGGRSNRPGKEVRSMPSTSCQIYKAQLTNSSQQQPSETFTEEAYVQLDIELVRPEHMPWFSWYASYGDLGGILGRMARNLGLIIADSGLLLRLQELDDTKKQEYKLQIADKNGLLWLSEDPIKVMELLNLFPSRFYAGFNTVEEMYAWLGQSRLAAADVLRIKRNTSVDRMKQNKRTIYSTFMDSWLPDHLGLHVEMEEPNDEEYLAEKAALRIKRQEYRDEALDYFDKRAEYEGMRDALVLSINNQIAKHLLRPLVAKHSGSKDLKLSEINRAFGRWVGCSDRGVPYVKEEAHSDEESELHNFLNDEKKGLRDEALVDEFVAKHWEELKYLERERAKALRPQKEDVDPCMKVSSPVADP